MKKLNSIVDSISSVSISGMNMSDITSLKRLSEDVCFLKKFLWSKFSTANLSNPQKSM